MKKLCILLLLLALLLSLGASAWAEEGVEVEVIIADGESIVVVSPKPSFADVSFGTADFTLPAGLLTIEEEAFAGISAQRVEVSWNVGAIGPRAFAGCPNLLAISIPDTVTSIDDSALAGCGSVTVFGPAGSEAQRFAEANGLPFAATFGATAPLVLTELPTAVLPFVPLG